MAGQVQALADVAVTARADATNRADAVAAEEARQHRSAMLVSATAREEAVQQAAPGMADQTARLERHRQAEVLAAQLQAVDTSLARADAAESAAESALTLLRMAAAEDVELAQLDLTEREPGESGLDPTGGAFASQVAETELGRLRSLLAVVEDRLPDEDRLRDLRRQHSAALDQHTAVTTTLQELTAREARLATERADLRSGLPDLEALAGELALRTKAAADAHDLVLIVRKYSTAAQSRDTVQARFEQAREVRLDTKQRWLDLREARLLNAAAELAAQLAAGGACPVCGSTDHPALAVSAASGPGLAQAEEMAAAEHDGAEAVFAQVAALLNDADQQVAVLAGQGGATPEAEAVAAAAGCREAAADAQDASERLAMVRDRLQDLELVLESSVQQRTSLESELSQATAAMASFAEQTDALDEALLELRNGHRSLPQRLRALESAVDVLAKAINAQEQRDRARSAAVEAREQLAGALPDAGFDSAEEARNQLLDPAQVLQLQASIRGTLDEAARVSELFASPDLVLAKQEAAAGGNLGPQGLLALREASAEADALARDAELSAGMARRCLVSVQTIRAEYAQLAGSAEGPAENARMLAGLADAASGRGDNTYRMSLNSYVLAARLEQVAAAASERLVAMSDGRYLLQYTDAKAAKGAKSGLGLEVVDQWTGFRRDTSTLSGGESFMASLSLALGLADVVQQESGGVEIETLFVDEGFGSLDEQSLEQVMDALEGLRDGGRVVGLVSHVAEMKQRIGVQLQVIKARNGSSLRISDAVELTD
ncbi:SbcC/MukB-like Walker B domain-containing protein [Arthrobacter ulcerisalmonis]|uniref:SbcC/MukB-like Walker B domain-containing protein n=1 Tax=Arthrobacter ulcerisalmonis TaxID=2483813 RepID=UPI00363887AF